MEKEYVAAMTREMRSPLEKIINLVSETAMTTAQRETQRENEIKDAVRYLLSLVDELSQFAQFKP